MYDSNIDYFQVKNWCATPESLIQLHVNVFDPFFKWVIS
jgi:hypothetical protein